MKLEIGLYISLKDGSSRQVVRLDGEAVTYEKNGKQYEVKRKNFIRWIYNHGAFQSGSGILREKQ